MFAICKKHPQLRVYDLKIKFKDGVAEVKNKSAAEKLLDLGLGIEITNEDPRQPPKQTRAPRKPNGGKEPDGEGESGEEQEQGEEQEPEQ